MTVIVQDPERVVSAMAPYDRRGHEARYRLAAGFLSPGDRVIDAACGTGYGAALLEARGPISYLGVEIDLSVVEYQQARRRRFLAADLEIWGGPPVPFDVAIVFETLEHLRNPRALVEWTFRARRFVLISVPIVPTPGNPYHRHDFARKDIEALYAPMYPVAYFEQPDERSGVWVYGQWGSA
jgi:SAM-dependent methyltransferase